MESAAIGVDAEPVTAWGALAAIDLRGCDGTGLRDPEVISAFITELIPALGMEPHGPVHLDRFGEGELEGWSAMRFIKTSTVTVHADEVGARCFIDIFSCKPFSGDRAAELAVAYFGGKATIRTLIRS